MAILLNLSLMEYYSMTDNLDLESKSGEPCMLDALYQPSLWEESSRRDWALHSISRHPPPCHRYHQISLADATGSIALTIASSSFAGATAVCLIIPSSHLPSSLLHPRPLLVLTPLCLSLPPSLLCCLYLEEPPTLTPSPSIFHGHLW